MKLAEQHVIKKGDPRYRAIDAAAFASKNLHNQATYQIRQAYIHEGKYLPYAEVFHRVKHLDCYQALPRKVSNSILILIHKNWVSFFRALEEWREHPEKFAGRPKIPGYKPKEKGRNILLYDLQAIGKRAFKKTGKIVPSGLGIEIETRVTWEDLDQVRIIPSGSGYVVEVIYRKSETPAHVDPNLIAAIDLGVDTLAAVTSNKPGFVPQLINGRPLKHLNAYYNKQRSKHQSMLAKESRHTSRQLNRITTKRNRRINTYLHTASRRLIDQLVSEGIGTLVIGLNKQWKQEINIGRHNNQTICHIPHSRFIQMLEYKAQLVGLTVIVREESYTSKASFLDLDPIPSYNSKASEKPVFSGRRETRGLYRSSNGRRVQADVNGSYNILRKEFPHAFCESQVRPGQQIGGAAVHPCRMNGKRREDICSSVSASRLNGCDDAFAIIS
jgi:putative transposase